MHSSAQQSRAGQEVNSPSSGHILQAERVGGRGTKTLPIGLALPSSPGSGSTDVQGHGQGIKFMPMVPHAGAMIFLEYAFLTCSRV